MKPISHSIFTMILFWPVGAVISIYKRIRRNKFVCFMLEPRHPLKYIRMWRWKHRVNKSIRILDELDWHLKLIGWTRPERRRFWREFHKRQEVRTAVFNKITQE